MDFQKKECRNRQNSETNKYGILSHTGYVYSHLFRPVYSSDLCGYFAAISEAIFENYNKLSLMLLKRNFPSCVILVSRVKLDLQVNSLLFLTVNQIAEKIASKMNRI